jgi:CHAT domain-containing protein
MYAGASALVTTLWQVDERSTWILMERFYKEFQNGVSPAESLKRAQLYLKNLTCKEARDVLARFSINEDDPIALPDADETFVAAKDAEGIFADPYYWAPFILVGSYEAGFGKQDTPIT